MNVSSKSVMSQRGERGVTAVEYALVVSSIVLFIIVGVAAFGPKLVDFVAPLLGNF